MYAVVDAAEIKRTRMRLAEAHLKDDGNYEWLLDAPLAKKWWNVQEVALEMGVADSTVRRWCKDGRIHGAIDHGKRVGWRMPRGGLVLLFAHYEYPRKE